MMLFVSLACFFFFWYKSLGGFSTSHSPMARARPSGSKSTYRRLTKSPTNGTLTLAARIELRSFWDLILFLTNYANPH